MWPWFRCDDLLATIYVRWFTCDNHMRRFMCHNLCVTIYARRFRCKDLHETIYRRITCNDLLFTYNHLRKNFYDLRAMIYVQCFLYNNLPDKNYVQRFTHDNLSWQFTIFVRRFTCDVLRFIWDNLRATIYVRRFMCNDLRETIYVQRFTIYVRPFTCNHLRFTCDDLCKIYVWRFKLTIYDLIYVPQFTCDD